LVLIAKEIVIRTVIIMDIAKMKNVYVLKAIKEKNVKKSK
jgi:hypothetical protein